MTHPPVTVLLADDDPVLRSAMLEVLAADERLSVVAAVADACAATRAARRHLPTVALVDTRLPSGGGTHLVARLQAASPETRVVAMSSHDDRRSIVSMFRAGAVSYLLKGDTTNDQLTSMLVQIGRGEFAVPPAVGKHLLGELSSQLERSHEEQRVRELVEGRVDRLLAAGQVDMAFQPIVDLHSRGRRGIEALARFRATPTQTPDRWFADAASVGLGVELELLAVRSALRALQRLPPGDYLAVNVSPTTAIAPVFQNLVLSGRADDLVMEITEHAPIQDYDLFQRQIEPLRAAGLRLAVDDAGAGFASLRHILLLAPDLIKLDMSLTRGVHVDRSRRAMARALISFAAETGATIVAEGIEEEAELQTLRDLGVRTGQGYLIGRPTDLEAALASTHVSLGG